MTKTRIVWSAAGVVLLLASPLAADPVLFSTGNPDGLIGTLSSPAGSGMLETETADDFILGQNALVTGATFTGLLPISSAISTGPPASQGLGIQDVQIELYHVFPADSTNPPDGRVPTRTNSPSDNNFAAFDEAAGDISVTTTVLNTSFAALNSVETGIHAQPNQFTGGEGPVFGTEVEFTIVFNTPFFVGATDHDFFRPEVNIPGGFLWLSAPRPIVPPGTPFAGDLEAWIRNDGAGALDPDWLRIGTDIVNGPAGPTYNMAFSLEGVVTPEPRMIWLLVGALLLIGLIGHRKAAQPD